MTSKKLAVTLLPRICSEALMGTSCDNPLGDHVVDRVIHERTADLEFVLSAAIWLKFHGIIAVFAFEFLGLGIAPAQDGPEESVQPVQDWPRPLSFEHGDLL